MHAFVAWFSGEFRNPCAACGIKSCSCDTVFLTHRFHNDTPSLNLWIGFRLRTSIPEAVNRETAAGSTIFSRSSFNIVLIYYMIQALKEEQQTVSEQAETLKSLQKDVELLTDQLLNSASFESVSATSKKFEGSDEIEGAGKQFSVTESPWLEPSTFALPKSFKHHPESPERFASATSYNEGTLIVILSLVPEKWQENILNAPHFRTTVRIFNYLAATACKLIHSC